MHKRKNSVLPLLALALLVAGLPSSGGRYRKYNFPAGTVDGSALINDSEQVADYYAGVNFNSKGYLQERGGTFTTLSLSGQVGIGDINQGAGRQTRATARPRRSILIRQDSSWITNKLLD